MERGTLYLLRNLINRRNVTTEVKSNVNANEDFLEVVVTGHVIVTAMCEILLTIYVLTIVITLYCVVNSVLCG